MIENHESKDYIYIFEMKNTYVPKGKHFNILNKMITDFNYLPRN